MISNLIEKKDFGICRSFLISNLASPADFVSKYVELRKHTLQHHFLLLLEEGQAGYTSSHAIEAYALDDIWEEDLLKLPSERIENNEHITGYLETPEEFFIRKRNYRLRIQEEALSIEGLLKERDMALTDDFLEVNKNPFRFLPNPTRLLKVPVAHPYESLFAFPNGYFDDDLSPVENFVLAKYLYEEFDLNLVGLSDTYLCFLKTRTLNHSEKTSLVNTLKQLYSENHLQDIELLVDDLLKQELLMLPYALLH